MTATAEGATAAAHEAFGAHPGHRALHAKGTLLKGSFTATPQAAALTRAAHLQGQPTPVTARVSNGGGDPEVGDYVPDVRGLAVKFYLTDDSRTDIVAQTAPRWPVHTPEGFLELLSAQKRAPSMLWRMPWFLLRHPSAAARLPANTKALLPVQSYATTPYYAIHAYRFLDPDGGSRFVRYTWIPEAGVHRLGPREARTRGPDYLQTEIRERIGAGPVRFTLELQLATEADAVDDPASIWPPERERVAAGTLELTALETERETGGDVLVFDPTRVTDGIALSNDPVLHFRRAAYSDSIARRMEST